MFMTVKDFSEKLSNKEFSADNLGLAYADSWCDDDELLGRLYGMVAAILSGITEENMLNENMCLYDCENPDYNYDDDEAEYVEDEDDDIIEDMPTRDEITMMAGSVDASNVWIAIDESQEEGTRIRLCTGERSTWSFKNAPVQSDDPAVIAEAVNAYARSIAA